MDLSGKKVLILGLGISGTSAANFCAAKGALVLAADEAPASEISGFDALAPGIETVTGTALPDPADFDLVVPSPGIPNARYAERARAVAGDIELAGQFLEIPIVAVTGTNGKSTTVRLIEAMLQGAGLRARAAGNLGTPALSLVGEPLDAAVLEVSSFQLEAVEHFRPRVAVVLNISPDHLDRHGDFEAYRRAKLRIVERQGPDDVVILNFDDPVTREFENRCEAQIWGFSRRQPVENGVCLDAGVALIRDGKQVRRVSIDGLRLAGVHNLENVLAALAAVTALGVDPSRAIGAVLDFPGLPHRSEYVASVSGVTFINDSKATNPGAAVRSLEGFDSPVVWIAGGRDKGLDFAELADMAAARVKSALFYGESAGLLAEALAGRIDVRRVEDLAEAVALAATIAQSGDTVLLAPACASFDQFKSFEDRGDHFRLAVRAIAQTEQTAQETKN
ncbi:MAG: UDP-N-acetylmuramoyl-L-alanine--D-glutamate ligase [Myxococcales bacterium]|nr:UDP-N-acetylmuramoyl-L-alanine--D-glutamate ligase [Myxococcales bacterium]